MRIQLAQSSSAPGVSGEVPAEQPLSGQGQAVSPANQTAAPQQPQAPSATQDAQSIPDAGIAESAPAQAPVSAPPQTPVIENQGEPAGMFQSMLDSVAGFIDLGGPVVALLLLLSVFALTIILLKLWQFYGLGGASKNAISRAVSLWFAGDYEKAISAIRALKGPVARVVAYAMVNAAARRDEAHLREETEHLALSEVNGLRSYLRGLEAVVQVAPLLGLFGTVLGMIEAFRSLESAGAQVNPADLAGGIWVALLTTAVGLAIAMPTSLVLHWFESRVARVKARMELFATEILTNPPARAIKPAEGARVRLASAAENKNAN